MATRRRWFRTLLGALALATVFLSTFTLAFVWHLNTPAGRSLLTRTVNQALQGVVSGTVHLGEIEHIEVDSLKLKLLTVDDRAGRRVLQATGIRVQIPWLRLAFAWALNQEVKELLIPHVRLDRGEIWLFPNDQGEPSLLDALSTTAANAPPSSSHPASARSSLRIRIPTLEIGQQVVHASGLGPSPFDVTLSNLHAAIDANGRQTSIDLDRFSLIAQGLLPRDIRLIASFHFRSPDVMWTTLDGWIGELQVNGAIRTSGKHIQATLDLPKAVPAHVKALLPAWPVAETVSAHLEASGTLPNLAIQLGLLAGSTELSLNGQLAVSAPFQMNLAGRVSSLDLRLLGNNMPETSLNIGVDLDANLKDSQLSAQFRVASEPTQIGQLALPALQTSGSADAAGVRGHALILEPGIPITADYHFDTNGILEVNAQTRSFALEGAPRLRSLLDTHGVAQLSARTSIKDGQIDSTISGSVGNLSYNGVKVKHAQLQGSARGRFDQLEKLAVQLSLKGEGLNGPNFRFGTFSLTSTGTLQHSALRASLSDPFGPTLGVQGDLTLGNAPALNHVVLSVRRSGDEILGSVEEFRLSPEGLSLKNLKLEGHGGDLQASVQISRKSIRIHAHGEHVDLDAVTRILGLPRGWLAGTLSVNSDIEATPTHQRGILHFALGNATLGPLRNVSVRADGELNGPQLSLRVSSLVPAVGAIGFATDTTLAGPISELQSYKGAIGSAELQLDRIRLSWLNPALFALKNLEPISGYASARISLARTNDQTLPAALFVVETHELEVKLPQAESPPLVLSGLNLSLGGTLNGQTGNINLTSVLKDPAGVLLSGVLSADLDLSAFERSPLEALANFDQIPIQAQLALEERSVDKLPAPIALTSAKGQLKAQLGIAGTLSAPSYEASADLRGFVSKHTRLGSPVDVRAHAAYQTSQQLLTADAQVLQGSRAIAQVELRGNAPPGAISGRNSGDVQLEGTGNISRLPLSVFAPLADADIMGELTGPFSFGFKNGAPALTARIDLNGAAINQIPVARGRLEFTAGASQILARVRAEEGAGTLDATALIPLEFSGAIPHAAPDEPISVQIRTKRFGAGILLPLLSDIFTELDGKVDADLDAELKLSQAGLGGAFSGQVELSDGRLQLAAMGTRLNAVSFKSLVSREGENTTILINLLKANVRSDVPNLEARAIRLNLSGLRVESGEAQVHLTHPVPVLIEGVSQATVTGVAELTLKRQENQFDVNINVPKLTAKLPKATSRQVIDVTENPDIVVAQPMSEENLKRVRGRAVPWVLHFRLGPAVSVNRSDLVIPLQGNPELRLGATTEVLGTIDLTPGGRVQLLGKAFVIERGSVRFDTGDSANPRLDVTASWRAPDGTTVYVDIRGTFKHGSLSLRSDPPLGDVELQTLLLGGSSGQGDTSAESTGIGIGAGLLGDLLADTPLGNFELRTASENTNRAGQYSTYTAAYQLSDQVWFEGSYKRAEDPVSQERGDAFSGTVDWRFRRNWSLRTEVGRLGTKMDVLWRYRY